MTQPAILIFGADGQVGSELQRSLAGSARLCALNRSHCDVSDPAQVRAAISKYQPKIIVNASAYTAVDRAESEEPLAHRVNAKAPGIMATEARRSDALLIHYSTDYVFDGTKSAPYDETDAPNPLSAYGRSKLAGEEQIAGAGPQHVIFRSSWVVSAHGVNFLKTILRLAKERDVLRIVADQFGAPTSAAFLAEVTAKVAKRYLDGESVPFGLYHLTNAGSTSWHGLAVHVVAWAQARKVPLKAGPDSVMPIPTEDYPLPAARPKNSRMDTRKASNAFDLTIPAWQDSIDSILEQIV
jgi:dTDP-4-dehydrorhamnose reductase